MSAWQAPILTYQFVLTNLGPPMVWPWKKSERLEEQHIDAELQEYYKEVINNESRETGVSRVDTESSITITRFGDDRKPKTMKQIALDNCVEFERAYSKCLVSGSYFERFGSCQSELTMYNKCKDMQLEALSVLGYSSVGSDAERRSIKMKADDLMIEAVPTLTITESQCKAFDELLSNVKQKA